jgi:flavin reductase
MQQLREPSNLASIDEARFKAVMRCMASTVTVITSRCGAVSNGMTATAVCSVSATPPSVLIVINRSSRSHALIAQGGSFAVNVLSSEQAALAHHFATKADDPLQAAIHRPGVTGVPVIEGCAAEIECVVETEVAAGTHSIFIGRVVAAQETDRLPLIYRNGEVVRLNERAGSRPHERIVT